MHVYFILFKVLFYSTEIFKAAGVQYSEVATIVVGLTLLVFTIVTVSSSLHNLLKEIGNGYILRLVCTN